MITHPSTPRVLSAQYVNNLVHIYNKIRVPWAIAMSKSSDETGYLCNYETPEYKEYKMGDSVPRHMLVETGRAMEKNWAWTTQYADEDVMRAVELLGGPRAVL